MPLCIVTASERTSTVFFEIILLFLVSYSLCATVSFWLWALPAAFLCFFVVALWLFAVCCLCASVSVAPPPTGSLWCLRPLVVRFRFLRLWLRACAFRLRLPAGAASLVLPAWSLFGGASLHLFLREGPTECKFF